MRREPDRSLAAFLRAIRTQPFFGPKLLSAVAFLLALINTKGLRYGVTVDAATIVASVVLGYPLWRKWGRRAT
jgi:hypothetical protein